MIRKRKVCGAMEQERQTDADILWSDVLSLLQQKEMAPSTLAMLDNCNPVSLVDGKLTVTTNLGFARRKIEQEQKTIESCLAEAAFQPITLEVTLSRNNQPPVLPKTTIASAEEIADLSLSNTSCEPQKIKKIPK